MFPGKPVLYLGPIGTECLRTYVERLACIQFDSSMVHCARLCTITIPNVARSILIHAARPETREGPRVPYKTIENRRVASSVLSTVGLHFFSALVLCPEEEKMKLLCSAACRFAAELLFALNAFCRFLSTLFSLRIEAISLQTKSEEPSRVEETTRVIFCAI